MITSVSTMLFILIRAGLCGGEKERGGGLGGGGGIGGEEGGGVTCVKEQFGK